MARNTAIHTVDDITGEPARETVFFALDGVGYEIDLTAEHADDLRDILRPYIEHGRRTGGRRHRRRLIEGPTPVRQAPTRFQPRPASRRVSAGSRSEQPERTARQVRRGAATTTRQAPREPVAPKPTRRRPPRGTKAAAPSPVPSPVPTVTFSAPAS
ncbi:Lsr2 dimerization domain-containing protein [Saccharomonospora cyanea]|uniref:Lsr2 n=1 Tax=Saccharomonospora cyanea NA-134 TaxID=882082 RepID=H5XQN8_9PSEU|nr:histone-like nucleoid-structuring protein Lsr2 [Saccharomonospora cyanea]EHR60098.1 Lsr2 [Saccharomonospora cyanea NA-134]